MALRVRDSVLLQGCLALLVQKGTTSSSTNSIAPSLAVANGHLHLSMSSANPTSCPQPPDLLKLEAEGRPCGRHELRLPLKMALQTILLLNSLIPAGFELAELPLQYIQGLVACRLPKHGQSMQGRWTKARVLRRDWSSS